VLWRARVLAALAFAMPMTLAATAHAGTCTCGDEVSPERALHDADAALVGEVLSDRLVADGTLQRVRVDEVYVGDLPPRIEVYARIGQGVVGPCAVLFSGGQQVAMILRADPLGRLTQDACSMVSVDQLRRIGGTARPPDPTAVSPPTGDPAPVGGELPARMPAWQVGVIGLVVALLLIAGSVALTARRDRRAAAEAGSGVPPEADGG